MKHLFGRLLLCSVAFAVGTCSIISTAQTTSTGTENTTAPAKPLVKKQAKVVWIKSHPDSAKATTKIEDIDIENISKELKDKGIIIDVAESETSTSSDGSAPKNCRKAKIIRLDGNGVTSKELTNMDDIDGEVKKALEEAEAGLNVDGKRVITIDKDVSVSTMDGNNSSIVVTTTKNGKNKQCTVKYACDSTKKGKCYAFSINGVDASVMKTIEDGIKGLDEKTQALVKDRLNSMHVNIAIPDSAMVMTLNANELHSGDVNANVSVFVANDDGIKSTDDKNVSVNVSTFANDGKNSVKRVYVLRMKKDGADQQQKVTTETTPNNETLKLNDFLLSPNPSEDGRFTLQFNLQNQSDTRIRITDINGREVYTESLANFSGAYNKALDLSTYGKGVYVVNVQQAGKSASMKLVIE